MNLQALPLMPLTAAQPLIPQSMAGALEEQPLEVQVQYLKQVIVLQQQMLAMHMHAHAGVEAQNRQLQEVALETNLAANDRIRLLEEALNQQVLHEQKSLLMVENKSLRAHIVQLKGMQEDAWEANLKATSVKVVTIANKIKALLQELGSVRERTKGKAAWYDKIYPKTDSGSRNLDIGAFIDCFHALNLSIQEIRNGNDEYGVVDRYIGPLNDDCLAFVDKFEMQDLLKTHLAKHPEYKKINLMNLLQQYSSDPLEMQPLNLLNEETIAKIKTSNAALRALKENLQKGHEVSFKALKLITRIYHLEPCINNIKFYIQQIANEHTVITQALPTQPEYNKISFTCALKQMEFIKDRLSAMLPEIEEIALDFNEK